MSVGYCGADLKALCTEAALRAVRRRYPQIYKSEDKLQIDPQLVNVSRQVRRAWVVIPHTFQIPMHLWKSWLGIRQLKRMQQLWQWQSGTVAGTEGS
jgi:SpoVK/Ycf46/Vps4 family AAA+-type ATPase